MMFGVQFIIRTIDNKQLRVNITQVITYVPIISLYKKCYKNVFKYQGIHERPLIQFNKQTNLFIIYNNIVDAINCFITNNIFNFFMLDQNNNVIPKHCYLLLLFYYLYF